MKKKKGLFERFMWWFLKPDYEENGEWIFETPESKARVKQIRFFFTNALLFLFGGILFIYLFSLIK